MTEEPVVFHPIGHRYVHIASGKEMTPVSNVLNFYEGEFNTPFWSLYKAIESVYGKDAARSARYKFGRGERLEKHERYSLHHRAMLSWMENVGDEESFKKILKEKKRIAAQWARKSKKSREKGTKRHDKYEYMIKGANVIIKNNKPYTPMAYLLPSQGDFESSGIATEVTVFNEEFWISGRVDRVDKDGKDLEIIDYKTSETIDYENRFEKFNKPLDFLDNCNFNRYMLQMNTYGWMMAQFGFSVKKLTLVHDRTGESIDVPIAFDTVELMLNHWKKHGIKN